MRVWWSVVGVVGVVAVVLAGGCIFEVAPVGAPPDQGVPSMFDSDLAVPVVVGDLGGGGSSDDLATDLGSGVVADLSVDRPDLAPLADLAPPPSDLRGCTVISHSFAAAPPVGWMLAGDARHDATAMRVELTAPSPSDRGSLFWTTPITVTSMHARFRVYIGDGNGADGLALVLAQTNDPATGLQPTAGGGALGYRGMTGVAVELDTYRNGNEPNVEHVGFMRASDGAHLVYREPPVMLDCDCVRTIDVWLKPGRVRVRVDDQATLDEPIAAGDFTAGAYYLGFTASTGGQNNRHAVLDALFVAGPDGCE